MLYLDLENGKLLDIQTRFDANCMLNMGLFPFVGDYYPWKSEETLHCSNSIFHYKTQRDGNLCFNDFPNRDIILVGAKLDCFG
mmetsp:Transcript_1112/g.1456  ORF Transcript_1112/g.1456 Transcript_1112/m.1456 type:complete len:83 (+) Transcript_1112:2-250(+)